MPSPLSLISAGGPIVALLCFLSLCVVTLTLVKLWQFARCHLFFGNKNVISNQFLEHWARGNFTQAQSTIQSSKSPEARLLAYGCEAMQAGQLRGENLNNELQRFGLSMLAQLRAYLRPLEVIATVAPLIGLLGTVTGMIEAFQAMEAAGKQVDPSVLSGGIWQALLTTAVGLIVAIPASLLHSWFERKVEVCSQNMGDALAQLSTASARQPVNEPHLAAV